MVIVWLAISISCNRSTMTIAVDSSPTRCSHNRVFTGRRTIVFLFCIAVSAMNAARCCGRPISAFLYSSHRLAPINLQSPHRPHAAATAILRSIQSTAAGATSSDADESNRSAPGGYSLSLTIPTPEDMEDVGGLLSVHSARGDVILLDGDLGAGKTCFSRGFVRARTGSRDERVTSPTYLLSNTYSIDDGDDDVGGGPAAKTKIHHMDLYRLSGAEEDLAPLDLDNAFANGISLVEWPGRLGGKIPEVRLDVTLTIDSTIQGDDDDESDDGEGVDCDADTKSRCMRLVPHGDRWIERLKFLESEGYLEDLILESSTE